MSTKDKGKVPMEITKEEQLLKKFENIIINVNEYCKVIDKKIELIEEIVVDIRADLEKVQEISTHLFRTIENSRRISLNITQKSPN